MKQIKLSNGDIKIVEDAYELEEGEVEVEGEILSQNPDDLADEDTPPEEKEEEKE
jgi:hypothetical protein